MVRKKITRRKFSEAQKQKIVERLSNSKLTQRAFCEKFDIAPSQIYLWQKQFKNTKHTKKRAKHGGPFSPDDRKRAIETFQKSGMSQTDFAKTWGCSNKTMSNWLTQYKKGGMRGLEGSSFRGEDSKKRGRKEISPQLKNQIVETKKENTYFGLRKIRDFLRRFRGVEVSTKTISKTLKAEEIPLLPKIKKRTRSSDKIRHFERAQPMQLWQTDITSYVLTRQSQRVYFTVFMDDCSRYIVSWNLQLMQTSEFVMNTLLNGIQKFGKPEEVLTDQGRQYFAWRGKSKFQNLLIREGIEHVVARSHHPQTVGKCERFWETVGKEFWERVRPQELADARKRLEHFINYYNHFRPHQGLDGMVPADRFFGVENEVRKVLENTIKKNSLRLALDEAPRSPVFLIGQIGNTPLSMHGESGQLVLQTSDGTIQKLSYDNFGYSKTKGEDSGKESRDNGESSKTEGKTQGIQDSGQACPSSENAMEVGDTGRESESSFERSSFDGILDGPSEQNGDSQTIGGSTSENLANLPASNLGDACGTALTTEDESERSGDEHGRRSEETQEENCGIGNNCGAPEPLDCNSSNDARMPRCEHTDGGTVGEGEAGCKDADRDTGKSFEWQCPNIFVGKKEEEEN